MLGLKGDEYPEKLAVKEKPRQKAKAKSPEMK